MTITSHVFAYWGIFKYANGCKITFSIAPAVIAANKKTKPQDKNDKTNEAGE